MIKLLALYKRWISPALGPRCRFYPTCSSYAQQAIGRFGMLAGGWMTLTRLLRCTPLSKGGYDPLPDRFYCWRGPAVELSHASCGECNPEHGTSDDQQRPSQ